VYDIEYYKLMNDIEYYPMLATTPNSHLNSD